MKKWFLFYLIFTVFILSWGETTLESSFEGVVTEEEILLAATEDLRIIRNGYYPWSCSLFLDIPPSTYSPAPVNWGASLATHHVSLGRLFLTGAYDHLESGSFPAFYSWDWGPRLTLDRSTALKERWGWAVHDSKKRLILHYLEIPDYKQEGLFFHLGDRSLGFNGGILHTRLKGEAPGDSRWYDPEKSRLEEDLLHIQGTLSRGLFQSGRWFMRAEGAVLLPRLSQRAGRLLLSLAYRGDYHSFLVLSGTNLGPWISCTGDRAEWSRGAGISIELFKNSLITIESDLFLWTLPEFDIPNFEGSLSLGQDLLGLFAAYDYESSLSLHSWEGGAFLEWVAPRGGLRGEGSCQKDNLYTQKIKLSGELTGYKSSFNTVFTLNREGSDYISSFTGPVDLQGSVGFSYSSSPFWELDMTVGISVSGGNSTKVVGLVSGGMIGKY